jgi:hypothetical protein
MLALCAIDIDAALEAVAAWARAPRVAAAVVHRPERRQQPRVKSTNLRVARSTHAAPDLSQTSPLFHRQRPFAVSRHGTPMCPGSRHREMGSRKTARQSHYAVLLSARHRDPTRHQQRQPRPCAARSLPFRARLGSRCMKTLWPRHEAARSIVTRRLAA